MFTRRRIGFVTLLVVLLATAGIVGTVSAQNPGVAPHKIDKLALGEEEVKQLLLLMDTDKNGKISKQEYMDFMEAEFNWTRTRAENSMSRNWRNRN